MPNDLLTPVPTVRAASIPATRSQAVRPAGSARPTPAVDQHTWQQWASCQTADRDLFFPKPGQSADAAKAICAGCPVRSACLSHALAHGERHGVWGGLTELERRRVERGRRLTVVAGPDRRADRDEASTTGVATLRVLTGGTDPSDRCA